MPIYPQSLKALYKKEPKRFASKFASAYINLRGAELNNLNKIEIYELNKLAEILRGLIFATTEKRQSGHPGGSSSKVEQFLALTLGGNMKFDLLNPKYSGRDRLVWSSGHCTPLLYSGLALYYETLRCAGRLFSPASIKAIFPEDLMNFRHIDGLPGHTESIYPLSDFSTGPSGHGFSAAGGLAILHKSSGLDTKIWVMMGDAESEEGLTFEARNILVASGIDNIVVCLDHNHFGLDGSIEEVIGENYANYWGGLGWNVIETDGHNFSELLAAQKVAKVGFGNSRPTVIISHTIKGKSYGQLENTAKSHGNIINNKEYIKLMKELGFETQGGDKTGEDIKNIIQSVGKDEERFILSRLQKSSELLDKESLLIEKIQKKIGQRKMISPTKVIRPKKLPKDLFFKAGEKVAMRNASQTWLAWLMKQSAFFYAGAGDVSRSVLTNSAEAVYGTINAKNPLGRGVRFGIAEQNMAMMMTAMTLDELPGGFKPATVFGTYASFSLLMANMIQLSLFNGYVTPKNKGFFIFLATHHDLSAGEDGPTHQGLFWQPAYQAMPGIKVYEPMDANEVVEMLFSALKKAEPIVLAIPRNKTEVFVRGKGIAPASKAVNGAYVFKDYENSIKKKIVVVVSGAKVMENLLIVLPDIQKKYNVKIIAVTSPELFVEYKKRNPKLVEKILSEKEKQTAVVLKNGSIDAMYSVVFGDMEKKRMFGIDRFLYSGTVEEVYEASGFSSQNIKDKIFNLEK
jgi:transketolase